MGKKEKEEDTKAKCKKCGSGQVYVRIKEGSVVCRSCGNIDPIED
jgi:ssDNA-binding Zn-finger/Zn-ribbon topoisomerase 1|tara:strand:- start:3114 stop:3248 length:135 start_codon:yes stop_codon:yes gene_type:complete